MPSVNECANRFQDFVSALMGLATLQSRLDGEIAGDLNRLPPPCVPEVYQESETAPTGSCDIAGEKEVAITLEKGRRTASGALQEYAGEVRDVYRLPILAGEISALADELAKDEENVVILAGVGEILTRNVNDMFQEFANCLREE